METATLGAMQTGANFASCTELYLWNKERINAIRYVFEDDNPAPLNWARGIATECFNGEYKDRFPPPNDSIVIAAINTAIEEFNERLRQVRDGRKSADEIVADYKEFANYNYDYFERIDLVNYFGLPGVTAELQKARDCFKTWFYFSASRFAVDFFQRLPNQSNSLLTHTIDKKQKKRTIKEALLKEMLRHPPGNDPGTTYDLIAAAVPMKGGKVRKGKDVGKRRAQYLTGEVIFKSSVINLIFSELKKGGGVKDDVLAEAVKRYAT